jgi:hypothetical protein
MRRITKEVEAVIVLEGTLAGGNAEQSAEELGARLRQTNNTTN